jgi:hypothetical protein
MACSGPKQQPSNGIIKIDVLEAFDAQKNVRASEFIRTIGTKGEGPGELIEPRESTMDPGEEYVFVHDARLAKLVRFSINGQFINEIDTRELTPARYLTGIQFINDNEFVLVNYRPGAPMDGYASLPVFDRNLNHVRDILQHM